MTVVFLHIDTDVT